MWCDVTTSSANFFTVLCRSPRMVFTVDWHAFLVAALFYGGICLHKCDEGAISSYLFDY
jgi:hypothetical protein